MSKGGLRNRKFREWEGDLFRRGFFAKVSRFLAALVASDRTELASAEVKKRAESGSVKGPCETAFS